MNTQDEAAWLAFVDDIITPVKLHKHEFMAGRRSKEKEIAEVVKAATDKWSGVSSGHYIQIQELRRAVGLEP